MVLFCKTLVKLLTSGCIFSNLAVDLVTNNPAVGLSIPIPDTYGDDRSPTCKTIDRFWLLSSWKTTSHADAWRVDRTPPEQKA